MTQQQQKETTKQQQKQHQRSADVSTIVVCVTGGGDGCFGCLGFFVHDQTIDNDIKQHSVSFMTPFDDVVVENVREMI